MPGIVKNRQIHILLFASRQYKLLPTGPRIRATSRLLDVIKSLTWHFSQPSSACRGALSDREALEEHIDPARHRILG